MLTLPPQEMLDLFGSVDVVYKWNPLCSVPVRLDFTESETLHVSILALSRPVFLVSDAIHWFKQLGLSSFEGWHSLLSRAEIQMCLEAEMCSYVTSARGGGELRDLFKRGSLNGDKHSEEKALLPSAFSMVCAWDKCPVWVVMCL